VHWDQVGFAMFPDESRISIHKGLVLDIEAE
jgi:hypothetical protein